MLNQYRDLFVIRRVGADVVIIGDKKYLEEIRALTNDAVRSVQPFLNDFAGDWVKGTIFGESDVPTRVLQTKLSPNLSALVPILHDELQYALKKELATCDSEDWVELDPMTVFPRIISRLVARVWIGPDRCRDEEWLSTTAQYTENLFITGTILRFVPRILRPVVAPMLPHYRQLVRNVEDARRIVSRLVADREGTDTAAKSQDVLQWLLDAADTNDRKIENLAQLTLILSLTAIHTTALTMAQALYDLCARPQLIDEARSEIVNVLGGEQQHARSWTKTALDNLVRLDSLLKESQRQSPVFLLTFNRILPDALTLSNGVYLPAGTRIAVPQNAIMNDPTCVPGENPATFDPYRYMKMREDPKNARRYTFAMTDSEHMAFGYGKYACPGRVFVANEIKLVLSQLLLLYDWRFPPDQFPPRPRNYTVDGDMYPDRQARVLLRRRKSVDV
jgi:cytochrome P450